MAAVNVQNAESIHLVRIEKANVFAIILMK